MSKTARKRIPLDVLRADENALFGLRTIEGYQPPNENFTLPVINAAYKRYKDTQEAEARLEKALAAARDESIAAEHDFHDGVGGSKKQVVAIYGDDSNEVVAVGSRRSPTGSRCARSSPRRPRHKAQPRSIHTPWSAVLACSRTAIISTCRRYRAVPGFTGPLPPQQAHCQPQLDDVRRLY